MLIRPVGSGMPYVQPVELPQDSTGPGQDPGTQQVRYAPGSTLAYFPARAPDLSGTQLYVDDPDGADFAGDTNDAVNPNDVKQGEGKGHCYLASSLSSVARFHPDVIRRNIVDNGDGSYTVTFYKEVVVTGEKSHGGMFGWLEDKMFGKIQTQHWSLQPEQVTVTAADMRTDGLDFGDTDKTTGKRELWPMVMDAAYAKWKGGFANIDNGGDPTKVMQEITGKPSASVAAMDMSEPDLQSYLASGRPMVLATRPDSETGATDENPYYTLSDGTKLVSGHAYHVAGYQDGSVILVNPWTPEEQIWVDPAALTTERFVYNGMHK